VNLLRQKLEENGYPQTVVNASISGDTTQDGLSRLEDAIGHHRPDIVIVELGGNDGLRAFPIDAIRSNLSRIMETIRESGAKIVLAGMRMPPNYGPDYTDAFAQLYPDLAVRFHAALVPFFMEGVATDPELMQGDGIHPNARGQPLLLGNVWPVLQPLLSK
ncbi:MAG: arylesterase, partial [Arenicellales bacterium]